MLCNVRYFCKKEMLLTKGKHTHTCVSVTFVTVNTLARNDLCQVALLLIIIYFLFFSRACRMIGIEVGGKRAAGRDGRDRRPNHPPSFSWMMDVNKPSSTPP